jgi:hypothetical protein
LTLFEYLSVALSIVLSLSAAQILGSLQSVIRPGTRYWVHAVWVGVALYTHVILWWEFWAFREVASWSLGTFLLALVNPGLLFVASSALVLADTRGGRSWEDHYFERRGSFFVPFGVVLVVSLLRDWVILDSRIELPRHAPELLMILICAVNWKSSSRRVHSALALLTLSVLLSSTFYLWLQPGGGSRIREATQQAVGANFPTPGEQRAW